VSQSSRAELLPEFGRAQLNCSGTLYIGTGAWSHKAAETPPDTGNECAHGVFRALINGHESLLGWFTLPLSEEGRHVVCIPKDQCLGTIAMLALTVVGVLTSLFLLGFALGYAARSMVSAHRRKRWE